MRIETAIVTAARALFVERGGQQRSVEHRDQSETCCSEDGDEHEVRSGDSEDRAEEEGKEVRVQRPGRGDHHDTCGDARIEEKRERLIAGRVMPGA
jgi:hypothetical protein